MPSSDEILDAMRQAGSEFARMADSIESRLPAIGEALSKAPAYLQPLKNDLNEVIKKAAELNIDEFVEQLADSNVQAGSLVQSMKSVQDALDAVSAKAVGASGDFRDIVTEAKASSAEVDRLTAKMDKFGDSLDERAANAKALSDEMEKAGRSYTPSRNPGGGGPSRNNMETGVSDDQQKKAVEFIMEMTKSGATADQVIGNVRKKFGDLTGPMTEVDKNFQDIESSVKALSGPINKAHADLSKMTPDEMVAWGREAGAAVGLVAKHAADMPDVTPLDPQALRLLQYGLKTMKDLADQPEEMRKKMEEFRKEIEDTKNVGKAFDKELADGIETLSDETRTWYGVSKKDGRAVAAWQAKHIKAAEANIKKGMNATYAYGVGLGKAIKDCPIPALRSEIDALGGAVKGFVGDLTKVQSFSMMGLAKAFVEVGDEVKTDRLELMKLTAEAGMLSSMFQAGMGAREITGEYEKLRQSMNNMLNQWGKTREESTAAMRSLVDAGFSMSSILGPTLKETEGGLFAFARAGEHAMSGLEEIAKVSAMTGKSMGDVATLAGQWREKLGVSIGEVGETYLQLESSARRSGLSVGKFMDRVMSSASGFVMFGGQVDEVANSLSNMMAGMTIPPGLASDVAADFMQRISGITMTEALTGIAMVGKAGTDELLKSAQSFHDVRAEEGKKLTKQIEALESSGLKAQDPEAYASKMGELQGKMRKVQEETGTYAKLLQDAAAGDRTAMAALYQEEAQRGHTSSRRMKILQDAATMDIKAEKLEKEGVTTERALLDELVAMERSGKKRILLEQQAKEAGYKSFKEMKEIVRGEARMADAKVTWRKKLGVKGEAEEEAFKSMADTGDVEGLVAVMKKKGAGPEALLGMMQDMQAEGMAISDAALEEAKAAKAEYDKAVSDFGAESDAAKEAAEKMQETAAATIAGVELKKEVPEEVVAEHAKKQTPIMQKISEMTSSIRKLLGGPIIAGLLAIKVAMDLRSLFSAQGKTFTKGIKGLVGGLFGKGKGPVPGAADFIGPVMPGAAAPGAAAGGGLASSVGGAVKAFGKLASKAAGPLAVVAGMVALAGGIKKMSDVYKKAKEQALKDGKTEAEARKIAIAGLKTMDSAKDVIAGGLSWILGDWLGGKIAGALTWIPGFEAAWSGVVDLAMGLADVFSALWDGVKLLAQAVWWVLKPVRVLATMLFKVVIAPLKMLGNMLGMVGGILGGLFTFIAGLFTFDKDKILGGLSRIGEAIWGAIKGLGEILLDTFKDIPLYLWDCVKFLGKALKAVFWDLPKLIWDGLKALPGLLWSGIKGFGSLWWSTLKKMPGIAWDLFKKAMGLVWKIWSFIPKLAWSIVKKLPGLIWSGIKGIGKVVKTALWDIPRAIGKGIRGLAGMIWDALSAIPGMIIDGFKALPGLIADGLAAAGEAIMGLGGAIWDWIKEVPGSIASAIGDIGKRFKDWLADALPWPLNKIFGGGGDDEKIKAEDEAAAKESIKKANAELKQQKEYEKGMAPEDQRRLKGIRQSRLAPAYQKEYEANMSPESKERLAAIREQRITGAPGGEDMLATAAKMQVDRDKDKKAATGAAGAQTTDNSTWNVHINSRSEKELQDAMLKTLVKHQQRLAN